MLEFKVKVLIIYSSVKFRKGNKFYYGSNSDKIVISSLFFRCIIGFVSNQRLNGSIEHNPFNFEHFNLNYLALFIDSVQIPSKPYTPDFTSKIYARNYNTLFSDSGILYSDAGNDITYKEYAEGYCLTVFDLTADMSCRDHHWNIIKSGTLRFDVRFATALTDTISAIIYAEFDNLIEIPDNRTPNLDYSS